MSEALAGEWFTAAEMAALHLPLIPVTAAAARAFLQRAGMLDGAEGTRWRKREGKGGGLEYHITALPADAQAALRLQLAEAAQSDTRTQAKAAITRDGLAEWFNRLPTKKKAVAEARARALDAVEAMIRSGTDKTVAMALVAREADVSRSTLYAWEGVVLGVARPDWLPRLAPRHAGATERTECPAEAWDMLRADYLRPERPTFESCWRRLERVAKARGWVLPSKKTMARRVAALPETLRVLAREGRDALKGLFPPQERTRGHFHALEAVNADGHRWDVFVRWPDGEIVRPLMLAFQDLYSGKLLSWRVDKTENKEATRLAFGDMVEQYGVPDHCWLDNGRQFASKWITGGTPNRYRFKLKDDEPVGLLTQLGVQVHWTTPYAGQSKPIERAFRDFAGDTAKHPKFSGAYVGNNPLAKPENYGNSAVPLDVFLQVIGEEIAAHNARPGRDTAVCRGRSFDEAFNDSYAAAPIKRAAEAQRRLWLLAAESIGTDRKTGAIMLEGNRFWSEFLTALRGTRVSVRFDPQALQNDLHVYALDGRYLGAARCIEAIGFDNADAAREHARARNAWMRGQRMQLDAERKMTIQQVAALLPDTGPAQPLPDRKIVRPVFGNTALAPREAALPEQSEREIRLIEGMRKLRLVQQGD